MASTTFETVLEKKSRGRSAFTISRPWAMRTFKLTGQTLEYYDADKLKGSVDIRGAVCRVVSPAEADSRPFPFELDVGKEKMLLGAPNDAIRKKCMDTYTLAAKDPNWATPIPSPTPVAPITAQIEQEKKVDDLQAQQAKLEEERLQQQAAAAATMLQEQASVKRDLEAAKEAERLQQEEQQRQAMELFKKMGAKARFRAAKEAGNMEVAREAAGCMLLGALRSKVAKRKVLLRKQEKLNALMSAAARKIQSRYRVRMARRRVNEIKAQKLHNKQVLAALKFQLAWRRHQARKIVAVKMQEVVTRSIRKQRGLISVQKCIRRYLSVSKLLKRQRESPTIVQVTVLSTEGLSGASAKAGVVVTGLSLDVSSDDPLVIPSKKLSVVASDEQLKSASVTSHDRSGSVGATQAALATAASKLDVVAVTLVDRGSGSKDDCLGQAFIRVADIHRQRKNADGSVTLQLPVRSLTVDVDDVVGKVVSRRPSTGTVTVKVQITDPAKSMCGWLWKMSEKMLGGNDWKKRWFVLIDGRLVYFNSELALETPKHAIHCNSINNIIEEFITKGRNGCMKVCYNSSEAGGSSFWLLDFDEAAPVSMKKMWKRKLFNNAVALGNPEVKSLKAKLTVVK